MTQIRNYAIELTASTIDDDDLIDVQIMKAGADQYKEARMKKSEVQKLMNDGATPLRYKALLSQNAPVASQTNGSFVSAGTIWTIDTYVIGDDFSNMELISGTMNTTGCVFRATVDTPTDWSNGSTLSYDGSPYIISKNINNEFSPFIDTLGSPVIFEYVSVNKYKITCTGVFITSKTFYDMPNSDLSTTNSFFIYSADDDNSLIIETGADDMLYYTPIEIEVYP